MTSKRSQRQTPVEALEANTLINISGDSKIYNSDLVTFLHYQARLEPYMPTRDVQFFHLHCRLGASLLDHAGNILNYEIMPLYSRQMHARALL